MASDCKSSYESYSSSGSSQDRINGDEEKDLNPTCESSVEDSRHYREGGYHPVSIGDLFVNRYVVKKKLGWGTFSTVWLCWDLEEKKCVAVKVYKSNKSATYTGLNEILLFEEVEKDNDEKKPIVELFNYFQLQGVNGMHVCIVFEALGTNLLKYTQNSRQYPVKKMKVIVKQILEGLDYLHTKCKIIHCDLKLDNIMFTSNEISTNSEKTTADLQKNIKGEGDVLHKKENYEKTGLNNMVIKILQELKSFAASSLALVCSIIFGTTPNHLDNKEVRVIDTPPCESPGRDVTLKIVDLGNGCLEHNKIAEYIQPLVYRAPEVILRADYHCSADIWSTACLIFQLATGDTLFVPKRGRGFTGTENHLGMIIELLGSIPKCLIDSGKRSKLYINHDGSLKNKKKRLVKTNLHEKLIKEYGWDRKQAEKFADFLLPMLALDPTNRATAKDRLHHEWLKS